MNKDKIQSILKWYGYENIYFDSKNNDSIYYYRTENTMHDYVIKVVVKGGVIYIYQATEDFYEKYDTDFYDYDFEARFSFDEIDKMNILRGEHK